MESKHSIYFFNIHIERLCVYRFDFSPFDSVSILNRQYSSWGLNLKKEISWKSEYNPSQYTPNAPVCTSTFSQAFRPYCAPFIFSNDQLTFAAVYSSINVWAAYLLSFCSKLCNSYCLFARMFLSSIFSRHFSIFSTIHSDWKISQ